MDQAEQLRNIIKANSKLAAKIQVTLFIYNASV